MPPTFTSEMDIWKASFVRPEPGRPLGKAGSMDARNQALLCAATAGNIFVVGELVRDLGSININATDAGGCNALILASQSGHAES